MLKVGIVGSESTHSQTFAGLANLPATNGKYLFNARVTTIWGADSVRTEQVAKEKKIPVIAEKPEDMIGKVDTVMVVPRRGGQHRRYAIPFLKAGISTWVDKPFTHDYADAEALVKTAEENRTLVCGGSICKFCCDAIMLRKLFLQMHSTGQFISGAFNFSRDIKCAVTVWKHRLNR
jgi:predicted dehydrogenase